MYINPIELLSGVETARESGELSKIITTAKLAYQTSEQYPGYIEQINRETGERKTGIYKDGAFITMEQNESNE